MKRSLPLAALAAAVACTTPPPPPPPAPAPPPAERTPSGFPTPHVVDALLAAPAGPAGGTPRRDIATWTLAGPFPGTRALLAHEGTTPWGRRLAQVVEARRGAIGATRGMECAARELGRFYLEQGALAPPSLEAFALGRCSAFVAEASAATVTGPAAEGASDEEVLASWQDRLQRALERIPQGAIAGVWFGKKPGRAVVFLLTAKLRARVDTLEIDPEVPTRYSIEGELLLHTRAMRAAITRGASRVGECTLAPRIALPRFKVTCEGERTDAIAWIELAAAGAPPAEDRTLASLMIWSPEAAPKTWTARGAGRGAGVTTPEQVVARVHEALAILRREAGLPPLAVEAEEERRMARAAEAWFSARNAADRDAIALGFRAGWGVGALVHDAKLISAGWSGARDPAALVHASVERPFDREVLLSKRATRVAVSAVLRGEPPFMGVLITTYSVFGGQPQAALQAAAIERIRRARDAALRPVPEVLKELAEHAARAAEEVAAGKATPDAALAAVRARAVTGSRATVSAWVIESSSLDDFTPPPELLEPFRLQLAAGVGWRRPEGEAWGRYVILVVAVDAGGFSRGG